MFFVPHERVAKGSLAFRPSFSHLGLSVIGTAISHEHYTIFVFSYQLITWIKGMLVIVFVCRFVAVLISTAEHSTVQSSTYLWVHHEASGETLGSPVHRVHVEFRRKQIRYHLAILSRQNKKLWNLRREINNSPAVRSGHGEQGLMFTLLVT